ncbi:HNH endonuclease [Campylobacter geochelonis]|uniref:HNH endonuclease n=1 Tax=Campylobacter geochelonis TaxID=1780362 RepID=UPI000770A0E9|nr:HNH endonuclease [Campylobacter geochelonis]CZE50300.1 Uncharacterised protein [Campylobacter geochelonis]
MQKQTKKAKQNQKYESYWSLTLEYTDFMDINFNGVLQNIVNFIDNNNNINSKKYQELQKLIYKFRPKKDMASVRKSINQFLKLGFINNKFNGYHPKTKEFLQEKLEPRKRRIYSEIMYDNASFKRSFSNDSNENEINFLVKTLEYCGTLNKDELLALMFIEISKYDKGYLNLDELKILSNKIKNGNVIKRKYNQVGYLINIAQKLSGIYIAKSGNKIILSFDEILSDERIFINRDPYKQKLYKIDLINEAIEIYKDYECVVEHRKYPILIASHIKPYIRCSANEAFDKNNGLLLSSNLDYLFDRGWITFDDNGKILCSVNLDDRIKKYLSSFSLDNDYFNETRKEYMKFHRDNVYNTSKEYKI